MLYDLTQSNPPVPDPTRDEDGTCESLVDSWACTRDAGHHGLHIAGTGTHACAMWDDNRADDPAVAS